MIYQALIAFMCGRTLLLVIGSWLRKFTKYSSLWIDDRDHWTLTRKKWLLYYYIGGTYWGFLQRSTLKTGLITVAQVFIFSPPIHWFSRDKIGTYRTTTTTKTHINKDHKLLCTRMHTHKIVCKPIYRRQKVDL